MPNYTTQDLRNIALVGQSGAGKTSLVEALLFDAGAITRKGSVEEGNTLCDYDPLEKQFKHSLHTSLASIDKLGKHINLLDTPGYPDFIGHALSAFPAVETVAVVINAQAGIEAMTRKMLHRAAEHKLCRLIVINKIDMPGVDLPGLVDEIKQIFGNECLPLNLPVDHGARVVDCFFNPAGESDFGPVSTAHTQIIDQVVEVDEALMSLYLEQGESLQTEQLHDAFEKALREGHLTPICFTSAVSGAGIHELFEIITRLAPSPLEGNPRPFFKGEGTAQPFAVQADASLHAVAHVFKVAADPFLSKLGLFRIHQGTLGKDSQLFIGDSKKPFKVSHLLKLQGSRQLEVEQGIPGDICALAKVDGIHHDAVLHDSHDEDLIHLQPMVFPTPLHGLAIVAKQGEEQKVSQTLQKLAAEDPCLQVQHDAELNQTVLLGMGELHLRVALEIMSTHYNVQVDTLPPKIPYRETIGAAAEGHYRHKKQTGGAGQFGEVFLRVEPLPRGAGFEFVDAVVGGTIPGTFIPAVEKGVRQVLKSGALAGYPIHDVRVSVYDGKTHPVDSKEVAFVMAGKKAFMEAVAKAQPLLLEPVMEVEVHAPDAAMGTITSDLANKRGQILGTDMLPRGGMMVKAKVPLAELSQYQTELKAATSGNGSFTMEFSHYEPVPAHIQRQLAEAFKPVEDKDA